MPVTSPDGTEIGFETSGSGPPLVLVHGTTADASRWRPLLPYLEPHLTVHAVHRRGRGTSGDGPDYSPAREFEDIAAVVDAVAEESGERVSLLGHSFGGFCSLGAALETDRLRRLVLYETPVENARAAIPDEMIARLQELLDAGDREGVVATFIREVVRMPDAEFEAYRALPAWPARVAAAHTIVREISADLPRVLGLDRMAQLRVPTLLIAGGDSPAFMRADTDTLAAALPNAQVTVLEGQQHIAIDMVPEDFAGRVLDFLRES